MLYLVKKEERRLQRNISKGYKNGKKGESYCKTSNLIKRELISSISRNNEKSIYKKVGIEHKSL